MAYDRNIDLNQVEYVIEHGEKIAEYPDDRPYISYLFFAMIDAKPLHVCFAKVTEKECRIISAYEPSLIIFESDFKTRRKK